jgi:hypothetical protein
MKPHRFIFRVCLAVFLVLLSSCDKVSVEITLPEPPVSEKDEKPDFPVQLGSIRGYFGDDYRIFIQHIEKVQPVDSFSNCYFYGACNDDFGQINLIRCDNEFVIALYILGYPLDSLPVARPVPVEFGKYAEIQFYPFSDWNSTSPGHYSLNSFYGQNVFISDVTDDVVTGTFEGILHTTSGNTINVTEGEFKLKLFRKHMPCGK